MNRSVYRRGNPGELPNAPSAISIGSTSYGQGRVCVSTGEEHAAYPENGAPAPEGARRPGGRLPADAAEGGGLVSPSSRAMYIPCAYPSREPAMTSSTVFSSNRSQAVRLPKAVPERAAVLRVGRFQSACRPGPATRSDHYPRAAATIDLLHRHPAPGPPTVGTGVALASHAMPIISRKKMRFWRWRI